MNYWPRKGFLKEDWANGLNLGNELYYIDLRLEADGNWHWQPDLPIHPRRLDPQLAEWIDPPPAPGNGLCVVTLGEVGWYNTPCTDEHYGLCSYFPMPPSKNTHGV